jgi:hypothetical protein
MLDLQARLIRSLVFRCGSTSPQRIIHLEPAVFIRRSNRRTRCDRNLRVPSIPPYLAKRIVAGAYEWAHRPWCCDNLCTGGER